MKIDDVSNTISNTVYIGDDTYERYGKGIWFKWYGESLEAEYSKEKELETAYQAYCRTTIGAPDGS